MCTGADAVVVKRVIASTRRAKVGTGFAVCRNQREWLGADLGSPDDRQITGIENEQLLLLQLDA